MKLVADTCTPRSVVMVTPWEMASLNETVPYAIVFRYTTVHQKSIIINITVLEATYLSCSFVDSSCINISTFNFYLIKSEIER